MNLHKMELKSLMLKLMLPALCLVMACWLGCSSPEGKIPPTTETLEGLLSRAEKAFEAGDAGGGAVLLLEAVLLMKPASAWPDGFVSSIEEARTHFRANSLDDAVVSVRDALVLVQPGAKERKKEAGGRVGAVAAVLKKNIATVRTNLERGNPDRAAVFILEGLSLLAR